MTDTETLTPGTETVSVGRVAPPFELLSVQGELISPGIYRGQRNFILWFSRGFQCNFCRGYMNNIAQGYQELIAAETEVIQVAPNLLESAQTFFTKQPPAFPFVCDPDKRLYAVYGLGDRGVLDATRNTVITFSTAFMTGEGIKTVYGSWLDVANRNFVRRLHHHALTAMEQGIFIIDKQGIVRYRQTLGPLEAIPPATELLALTRAVCK